jgi:alkanesulfonate monooxygenase SsuD/methylene tetrahydromethanopterin reductase-like flavin-dependent oxidoreductase (luciferase family)
MHVGLMSLGDHMPDPHTGNLMTGAQRHRMLVEAGVLADECGFSSFNIGEHHGLACITSSPPVILAAVAERTTRIHLGTAVALLANLDPLRVAEDYATLDALSGGRVDLVVGRGNFFISTYTLFGQDIADSHALFEENLELLLELWRGEPVHWVGKFRPPINGEALQPPPVQMPHAPVWVGGGSSVETAVLAGRLGLKLMLPSAFGAPSAFRRVVDTYLEAFVPRAPGVAPHVGGCWHVNVSATSQAAKDRWEPRYRAYQGWMQQLLRSSNPDLPEYLVKPFDFAWLTESGPAIVGSPAEVADRLCSLSDLLGLDTHLLKIDMGGMPEAEYLAMIELLGSDVLPVLR